MNAHAEDFLPHSRGVAELIRRVVFRLNGNLAFAGHKTLTLEEHSVMYDLAEASKILDRIAVLPRMAQHEERARRDLLEIFDLFNPREWVIGKADVTVSHVMSDDGETWERALSTDEANAIAAAALRRQTRVPTLTPTPAHVPPLTILELEDDEDQEDDE